MVRLNTRCKSIVLMVVMAISGSVCAAPVYYNPFPAVPVFFENHKTAIICTVVAVMVTRIRLRTKGTKHDYKLEDWRKDVKSLLNSYNIFDAESYNTVFYLIDKWVVGRAFKRSEVTKRIKNDDGTVSTIKDDRILSKPFGAMGLFSAYVLDQMKDLNDYVPIIAAFCLLVTDPVYAVEKAQAK